MTGPNRSRLAAPGRHATAVDRSAGRDLRVSRREILRGGALLGVAVGLAPVLAACTDTADVKRLAFLNWTDYIAPNTLKNFTRATGIDVTYETYTSNDELRKRLEQAGRVRRGGRTGDTFDLIVPSDNFVQEFRNDDLIQKLDLSQIKHLNNLAPEFRHEGFDPGNTNTVPWATGTTGIAYNRDEFDEPPGYDVFLDAKVKNKATILDEMRDAYAVALFSLGKNPNTNSKADIDAATDRLLDMKKVITGFESGDYWKQLAAGDTVVAQAYSSDFQLARERNKKLAFTFPAAGALRWVDNLAIPTDAPHKSAAEQFISYYLRPEVAAGVSRAVQVDTGNAAARDLLPASLLNDPVVFPPQEVLDRLVFTEYLGDDEGLYSAGWDRVRG
jgi:spermidine/putrescine transport system substrate-binding protein